MRAIPAGSSTLIAAVAAWLVAAIPALAQPDAHCNRAGTSVEQGICDQNGAAVAPSITSQSFHEAREGRYEITIQYPQIPASFGPAARAFNRAARAMALEGDALSGYRSMKPLPAAGRPNEYEAEYEITYLDPRLASVVFAVFTDTGAHPNHGRTALLFDLVRARALRLDDLLANAGRGAAAIAAKCKAQLEKDAKEEGWEVFERADIAAVVRDVKKWAVDKEGITLMFDEYAVAAYVTGEHDCRVSYAELAPLLKPDGPLPPK